LDPSIWIHCLDDKSCTSGTDKWLHVSDAMPLNDVTQCLSNRRAVLSDRCLQLSSCTVIIRTDFTVKYVIILTLCSGYDVSTVPGTVHAGVTSLQKFGHDRHSVE